VALRVRDTGPGIAPHERQRVFERFHRADTGRTEGARRAGSGLGLAICQAIVLAHGGQIRVEDGGPEPAGTSARGAQVVVTLPGLGDSGG
jgi:signal transduction histidine kinase